jgi:hypothetical protein
MRMFVQRYGMSVMEPARTRSHSSRNAGEERPPVDAAHALIRASQYRAVAARLVGPAQCHGYPVRPATAGGVA